MSVAAARAGSSGPPAPSSRLRRFPPARRERQAGASEAKAPGRAVAALPQGPAVGPAEVSRWRLNIYRPGLPRRLY